MKKRERGHFSKRERESHLQSYLFSYLFSRGAEWVILCSLLYSFVSVIFSILYFLNSLSFILSLPLFILFRLSVCLFLFLFLSLSLFLSFFLSLSFLSFFLSLSFLSFFLSLFFFCLYILDLFSPPPSLSLSFSPLFSFNIKVLSNRRRRRSLFWH